MRQASTVGSEYLPCFATTESVISLAYILKYIRGRNQGPAELEYDRSRKLLILCRPTTCVSNFGSSVSVLIREPCYNALFETVVRSHGTDLSIATSSLTVMQEGSLGCVATCGNYSIGLACQRPGRTVTENSSKM